MLVDGAPARHGQAGDDWFAHASAAHPLLAKADGRAGADRARWPVARWPVNCLEEFVSGRLPGFVRDGLAAGWSSGAGWSAGTWWSGGRAGVAAVSCSGGRGGRCRYRLVRGIPVLVMISAMV